MKSFVLFLLAAAALSSVQAADFGQSTFTFTTLAGSPQEPGSTDGTNGAALFTAPAGLAINSHGALFVADYLNCTVRELRFEGGNRVVTTIAGLAGASGSQDGTNSDARFLYPCSLAADGADNLYVADAAANTIRKIAASGTNWVVTTIAGLAGANGSQDGTNSDARFSSPHGLSVDRSGNLYVADFGNNTIRKLSAVGTNWVVTTIAGTAGMTGSDDGTNAQARFFNPCGLAVDEETNLYITDSGNCLIRSIRPLGTNWVVATIAGAAGSPGSADGTNSLARFSNPLDIAVDGRTNLYVADSGNSIIRHVYPAGTNWTVATLAGTAGNLGSDDGTGAQARFFYPGGIVLNARGDLFVSDTWNNTIRMGWPSLSLNLSRFAKTVVLSWPCWGTNYVLETTTNLAAPVHWTSLGETPVTVNQNLVVTNLPDGQQVFYRLHRQ
jgi:hypothetical protein